MLRLVEVAVQMGVAGLVIGAFAGGLVLHRPPAGTAIYALTGLLVAGGLLTWLGERYERLRGPLYAGMAGVLPGMMLGNYLSTVMGRSPVGVALGILWGVACFAGGWAYVAARLEKAGWYTRYGAEIVTVFFSSCLWSWLGIVLAHAITAEGTWLQGVAYLVVPFAVAGLAALLPGVVLSRNHVRPFFGSLLGILSGASVLWVGLNVAPLLLLPGSGLMWAGTVIGLLMMAASLLPLFYPSSSLVTGIVLICLSILSFIGAAGGLVIGGLVGILSGSLIASWQGRTVPRPATGDAAGAGSDGGMPRWRRTAVAFLRGAAWLGRRRVARGASPVELAVGEGQGRPGPRSIQHG